MSSMVRTLLGLALLLSFAACSGSDDAADGPSSPAVSTRAGETSSVSPSTGASPSASAFPGFAPEDYTYRLEVLCFCPRVGAVRVEVADGKVVAATALSGRLKGRPAPDFTRLTIDDIIDRANDPSAAQVKVVWPQGQDHPTSVRIDTMDRATDDEVTYVIRNVRVSAG